jgi:hypothetical protein
MTPLRQRMIEDMTLHGLKPKTIKAYVPCVARFARYFGKSPTLLGTPEIRAYLLYLTHEGCDRAHANDYATFFGFFFGDPSRVPISGRIVACKYA